MQCLSKVVSSDANLPRALRPPRGPVPPRNHYLDYPPQALPREMRSALSLRRFWATFARNACFTRAAMLCSCGGEPTVNHREELLHRVQIVACLTKERLLTDFPRNDIRSALGIFDRRFVVKAFGLLPDSGMRKFLLRGRAPAGDSPWMRRDRGAASVQQCASVHDRSDGSIPAVGR